MSDRHILVVEDDPLGLSLLMAKLSANGYQVTGAANVSQAMHATQAQAPDLMILDLNLLGDDPFAGLTDGYAFLSLLRRNHPDSNFPVIIHTGDPSPDLEAKAQAHGVYAVVRKGAHTVELLSIVGLALTEWEIKLAS